MNATAFFLRFIGLLLEAERNILQHGILFTGGEERNIKAWDITSGKVAYSIEDAHSTRVKGIVVLYKNNDGDAEENQHIVASASSDGIIRVWDVRMTRKEKPIPLAEANTKSRLTCLAGSSIKCESFFSDFAPLNVYLSFDDSDSHCFGC